MPVLTASEGAGGKTRAAIIGTGALGSTLLESLVGRTDPSVLLIDPDRVEDRNLSLSSYMQEAMKRRTEPSPGRPLEPHPYKADLLAEYATHTATSTCSALNAEIADVGWQDLRDVDVFYCCTDSALSRVETTYVARMLRKPIVDGGVFGHGIREGRVTNFSPSPEAACYLCGLSEGSRAAVLGYAASAAMGCRVPDDAPAMTGSILTIRRIATLMTSINFPFREQSLSRAVRVFTGEEPAEEAIHLTRSATCPWHEGLPDTLEALPWQTPLRASIRPGSRDSRRCELQLAWPVCTEAACERCGSRTQPFLRVARIRKTLCSHCGEGKLQPVRAVHRIRADDAIAERSPQQLGQPQRHLYWLRETDGLYGRREGAR